MTVTMPNVNNYHIGKGIVSFKETGQPSYLDLGNSPSFLYTPTVAKKEHFSSRQGVKTKDFTAITEIGATIKFILDEITGQNLSYFALATVTAGTGFVTLTGLTKTVFTGDIKVTGSNAIGQQVDFTATVSFVPSGDFKFITDSDDFSTIEIEAEVQANATDGSFGKWTIREQGTPPGPATITSVTPSTGVAAGGTAVTIAGTNFTGATSATFGGTAATSFSVVNSTTITCTTPVHAVGAVSVVVVQPTGNGTLASGFTYT